MNPWLIVPRDPLIFRDGKPFTATPGERSKSLGYPFPSTIAGAVRTLIGPDPVKGYDQNRVDYLKSITIRGPLLVELTENGQISNWYFSAPADALLVEERDSKQINRYALTPIKSNGAMSDLDGLDLIGPASHVKNKPYKKAPHYWSRTFMEGWLENADDGVVDPKTIGLSDLTREYRTHVSIDPKLQASREGALFQTSGMEFIRIELNDQDRLKTAHSLALAIETDGQLKEGADFLGGERRVVRWQKAANSLPACPEGVRKAINSQKYCRLILATPAYFDKGYLPERLLTKYGISVEAAALSRYQTISGWDYAKGNGGEPKPTRRLAPSGSVYFLNLSGLADTKIEAFINEVWLQPISDDDQSCRDGFGLALLGAWNGKVREMEVES